MGSRLYDESLGRFSQPDILTQIGLSGSGNSLALTVSYSGIETLEQYNNINSQTNGIVTTVQAPLFPQNLDRYAYSANNPIKYVDSSGHCFGYAGGIDTAVCLSFVPLGPPGWIIDGLIIIGGLAIVAGGAYLATEYSNTQQSNFTKGRSRGYGGAASAAQHLAMLLGVAVADFGSHPGMPDPEGRDRQHNAEGLRNDLKNLVRNMKKGENLSQYLSRTTNWSAERIADYTSQLRNYLDNVLPFEKGFDPQLIEELLKLGARLGV